MAATYQTTKETTNFARICRLVVGVVPDILRDLLIKRLPASGLATVLNNQKHQIFSQLNRQQKNVLFPFGGFQGSVKDFDVSVLYILLRNIGNIAPHVKGWGNVPDSTDRSLSANIDRLRVQRNEAFAHVRNAFLSDVEFKAKFDIIRQSVEEIENSELKTGSYVVAVDNIRVMKMDDKTIKTYIEELLENIKDEVSKVKGDIRVTNRDVSTLKEDVDGVKEDVGTVKEDVLEVKGDIENVKGDIGTVKENVGTVKVDVLEVKGGVDAVKGNVFTVKEDVIDVKEGVSDLKKEVGTVKVDVGFVREDVEAVKEDVFEVKEEVVIVMEDVTTVKEDVFAAMNDFNSMKDTIDILSTTITGKKRNHAAIETTKATVHQQLSRPEIICTKALEDAKKVIRENSLVIIRGASGDGKTMMCYQLLRWLTDGDHDTELSKDPLQLYNMSKWDKIVQPETKLALFIDDISDDDVENLKKRKDSIQSTFCGKLNCRSNCLILNVQDYIFRRSHMSELFNDEQIIDLRNKNAMTNDEKLLILEKYVPDIKSISGGKESEIVEGAPTIGFPQCCRLYRDLPGLKSEGVEFFKNPFDFIEKILKKLPKGHLASLLFLFFNGGSVAKEDLDPYSENIDKRHIEIAFDGIEQSHSDKIRLLRRSLGEMSRSLVARSKFVEYEVSLEDDDWSYKVYFDDDDDDLSYTFPHDSIQDTIAILYGKDTKIGFIENCPRKFLHYISTSKNNPNRIVVPSTNKHMYKRLVREFETFFKLRSSFVTGFESHRKSFYTYDHVTSFEVWTDVQFLQGFIRWLSEQNVDINLCQEIKLALLNAACSCGSEDRALLLLSEGANPDEDTPRCVLKGGCVNVLKQIVNYMTGEEKTDLLNEACSSRSEDCALFLLTEGVEPDDDTPVWYLVQKRVDVLKQIVKYVTDKVKHRFLNFACSSGSEDCAVFLLSEGVEPDNDTPFRVVKGGCVNLLRKLMEYDVTPTARAEWSSHLRQTGQGLSHIAFDINVLHEACLFERCEMMVMLCNKYPHLVHYTEQFGQSTLHLAAQTGNCIMFQTVEEILLKSLYRVQDEQHKCETVNGRVVHRRCACTQFICQLVDRLGRTTNIINVENGGGTVLHTSCTWGHKNIVEYLCASYPALTTTANNNGETVLHYSVFRGHRDVITYLCESNPALTTVLCDNGRHCLHYAAQSRWSDVDMFTECENHVKQYVESSGCKYDITTILDNEGKSVLDLAKEGAEIRKIFRGMTNDPLYDHIVRLFGQETH